MSVDSKSLRLQLRRPAFWLYFALVVAGIALTSAGTVRMIAEPGFAAVAWLGGAAQALLLVGAAWILLPRRQVARRHLVLAALLGGTFSIGMAVFVGGIADIVAPTAIGVNPLIEEITKIVAAIAILMLLPASKRLPVVGLIVGYFVGTGFEVVEDVIYTFAEGMQKGDAGVAWLTVVQRTLFGFGLHSFWTAVTMAGFTYAIMRRGRGWWTSVGAMILAVVLHEAWDYIAQGGFDGTTTAVLLVIVYVTSLAAVLVARQGATKFKNARESQGLLK